MIQHLIIEGHDSWVLAELWGKHLPNPKGYETDKDLKNKQFFKSANGYDNVPRLISATLKTADLTNLGVIVDANEKGAANRLQAIKHRLSDYFRNEILAKINLQPGGIVVKEDDKPLTVGIWIMPDNQSNGYLEHFLESMLPPEGKKDLWGHVQTTLKDLQAQHFCEFEEIAFQKAVIRTWLAWQKEPGLSYGTALSKGYFNPNVNTINPFLNWLANTFELN